MCLVGLTRYQDRLPRVLRLVPSFNSDSTFEAGSLTLTPVPVPMPVPVTVMGRSRMY